MQPHDVLKIMLRQAYDLFKEEAEKLAGQPPHLTKIKLLIKVIKEEEDNYVGSVSSIPFLSPWTLHQKEHSKHLKRQKEERLKQVRLIVKLLNEHIIVLDIHLRCCVKTREATKRTQEGDAIYANPKLD